MVAEKSIELSFRMINVDKTLTEVRKEYDSLEVDIKELIKLLAKIVKTTKESLGK